MIIKSNSVGGILANYGRGTWAAWTHLLLDGMAYKRIIIPFDIRLVNMHVQHSRV